MGADDRQDLLWALIEAVEAILGRCEQSWLRLKKFTMGDFPPKMAPQHFDGIEPRAVGRQVEQDQAPCRCSYDRFHLIILMRVGIIPSHRDGSCWMFLDQGFQQLCHLLAALATMKLHHAFSCMIVHRSDPVVFVRLPWR